MIDENKQVRINLVTNIVNLIINILIGIYYTPYLVRELGIVTYGIVPLALIINQYINVITGSLTGALTRFYSIALKQKNNKEASSYFSTSLFVIILIFLILLPLLEVFLSNIDHVFNIPKQLIREAAELFKFTILSLVISLISSIFNITLYSLNRLDLMNIIKILRLAVKFVLNIAFFELIEKKVQYIGYANFAAELFVLVISVWFFAKTTKREISIRPGLFNKKALSAVLGMAIWVIIHQVGDTGLYRTDNLLINIFWGTKESGILGALSDFGSYVIMIVSVVSSLFGPLILIAYAENEQEKVQQLALDNSLIVGVLTSLLTGILIGFSQTIIRYWLGPQYQGYFYWFIIKMITIPSYAAAGIFAFTYRAWNMVKYPAIATISVGIINLGITYFVYSFFNNQENIIDYMLTFSALLIIIQSYGLNSFYFARIYRGNGKKVIHNFMKILSTMIIAALFSILVQQYFAAKSMYMLLISMGCSGIICLGFTYFLAFNKHQKKQLFYMLFKK